MYITAPNIKLLKKIELTKSRNYSKKFSSCTLTHCRNTIINNLIILINHAFSHTQKKCIFETGITEILFEVCKVCYINLYSFIAYLSQHFYVTKCNISSSFYRSDSVLLAREFQELSKLSSQKYIITILLYTNTLLH